jgi:hypothetical protein
VVSPTHIALRTRAPECGTAIADTIVVMRTCASVPADVSRMPTGTDDRYVRVLRWTFTRDAEQLLCELGLTRDDSAYQLRVEPPRNPTGISVECYDDAMSAFQRHAAIERLLVGDGWTLERFESTKVQR